MADATIHDIRRQFRPDTAKPVAARAEVDLTGGRIQGCRAVRLPVASDGRGDLLELMSMRDEPVEPIVHVYQVFCAPGSIRAWIFHEHQADRLCLTDGVLRVALFDLRPESPTAGALITLEAGAGAPTFVYIPPFVAHGVQNVGSGRASFVNLPTRVYRPDRPDKLRLPFDSPLIPFVWS